MEFPYTPDYLNIEYFFWLFLQILKAIYNFFLSGVYVWVMLFIGAFFLFLTVFWIFGVINIRRKVVQEYEKVIVSESAVEKKKNEKWDAVKYHMLSDNPSNWRLAIIEADNILNEVLQKMGYEGDYVAERLKNAERGDFRTLDLAWEAHKVRNRAVHEGSEYVLDKKEAQRVVDMYEEVFREFNYI